MIRASRKSDKVGTFLGLFHPIRPLLLHRRRPPLPRPAAPQPALQSPPSATAAAWGKGAKTNESHDVRLASFWDHPKNCREAKKTPLSTVRRLPLPPNLHAQTWCVQPLYNVIYGVYTRFAQG